MSDNKEKSPLEEFFGAPEDQIYKVFSADNIERIGLEKAKDKSDSKEMVIGRAGDLQEKKEEINPTKGFLDPTFEYLNVNYSKYRPTIVPDPVLRTVSHTPLVGAILFLRKSQVRIFSRPSNDDNDPGYRIKLRDPDEKAAKKDIEEIKWLSNFFRFGGRTDYYGWAERETGLEKHLSKYVEDALVMNRVAVEVVETKDGKDTSFFRFLDGATIRKVGDYGYMGNKGSIDPKLRQFKTNEIAERVTKEREVMIPDFDKVKYVQEIGNQVVAAFEWKDLVFYQPDSTSDIWYNGYAPSRLEVAAALVRGFLNSLQYNANAFSRNSIPKIALSMKGGSNFSREEMRRFQQEWRANFTGRNVWAVPIINGDVQPIDLMKAPRDMEYIQYLQMMGGLIASHMGVDIDELGLNFQSSKAVLSENTEGRKAFSRDRGLRDLLISFETVAEEILMRLKRKSHDGRYLWEKYKFEFTGIVPTDKEFEEKIKKQRFETHTGFDQLRIEDDDKPAWQFAKEDLGIDDETFLNTLKIMGTMPKDSMQSFTQLYQAAIGQQQAQEAEEQPEQEGEEEEFNFDSMLDDVFKAQDEPVKPEKKKALVLNL